MDDPLDYLDLLDFVSGAIDAGNLDSDGIDALAGLLEKLDYTSFDAGIAHAVAGIDPLDTSFWADPGAGIFADTDFAEWGDFAAEDEAFFADAGPLASDEFIDAEIGIDDLADVATEADPAAVQASLNSAFASYPPAFTEGLTVEDIHYDPLKDEKYFGTYTPQLNPDGSVAGTVDVFDHAERASATLHHELGHHIARTQHSFFGEAVHVMSCETELWDQQGAFLDRYEPAFQNEELFAQAIKFYHTQPEILEEIAPRLFGVIDKHWAAASLA